MNFTGASVEQSINVTEASGGGGGNNSGQGGDTQLTTQSISFDGTVKQLTIMETPVK